MLLRRLILVLVLLVTQMVTSVHVLEHFNGKADGHLPESSCSVCLAVHDLASAVTSSVAPLPHFIASFGLVDFFQTGFHSLAALTPRQRGPPIS